MQYGVVFPQTEIGTDPALVRDFAQAMEAAGYDHLIAYDHVTGSPLERYEGPIGGFQRAPYTIADQFHEVFALFAHLAAVTERIIFVTSVLVLPMRQTVLAAKQAASVDILSKGRIRLGVGVGWNVAEYEAMGAEMRTRGRRLEEQITVMRRLWTEPLVTFEGAYHHIDRNAINPLPVQRPIPIWIGSGAADRSLRRVARMADGWMPLLQPGETLAESIPRLRGHLKVAGRNPETFPIEGRFRVSPGGPDDWRARAADLRTLGVSHITISAMRCGLTPSEQIDALVRCRSALDGA